MADRITLIRGGVHVRVLPERADIYKDAGYVDADSKTEKAEEKVEEKAPVKRGRPRKAETEDEKGDE